MKKLSLLLGALGGAMAGYLFSNEKLRAELSAAKDAETAAKLLGKHLQQDGKKLASNVQSFVESDEVQAHLKTWKNFAGKKLSEARGEWEHLVGKGMKTARQATKRAVRSVKRTVKTSVRKLG
ncbi:MAG: hypothetical protein V1926_05625 [Candidatus Peregrinibacteria bacterium]